MSLQPPSMSRQGQRHSSRPGPRATQFGRAVAISPAPSIQEIAKPTLSTIEKLQSLGIKEKQAKDILNQLSLNNDKPYYAGKLWNGQVYVVSRQDTVYYGPPTQLQKLKNVESYRTKCFNSQTQTRHYQIPEGFPLPEGFSLTVLSKDHKQRAIASVSLLGMSIKLPHLREIAFSS